MDDICEMGIKGIKMAHLFSHPFRLIIYTFVLSYCGVVHYNSTLWIDPSCTELVSFTFVVKV